MRWRDAYVYVYLHNLKTNIQPIYFLLFTVHMICVSKQKCMSCCSRALHFFKDSIFDVKMAKCRVCTSCKDHFLKTHKDLSKSENLFKHLLQNVHTLYTVISFRVLVNAHRVSKRSESSSSAGQLYFRQTHSFIWKSPICLEGPSAYWLGFCVWCESEEE